MKELQVIIAFSGFIALLLWGVHMVQTGVQRAFGKALGMWMARAMGSLPRAFSTGLLITAAIQSSTATGLMIAGFAMDGLVSLVPGLAAMLGANVGTTLIVQALSFNPTALAPGLILIGVWMFRHYAPGRARDLGRTFIGLGLLLLSLNELVSMFEPLKSAPMLGTALDALGDAPLLALLASTALTWASHSSVAVVVLIMSLAHHGLADPMLAYTLVLGANLGTAINPVLEGGHDDNPASRRLPVGNLGTRVAGCLLGMALLPWSGDIMQALGGDPAHGVANFHLIFNLIVAACFMPVLQPYAHLLQRLLPHRSNPDDPARPRYLDESAREVPAVALGQAARESLRLTDLLRESLQLTQRALLQEDGQATGRARYLNGAIGQLDQSITTYLATLEQESLSPDDEQYLKAILTFSMNIAHAASVSGMGLLGHASRLHKKHWSLDAEQRTELTDTLDRLQRNLRQAASLFVSGDRQVARNLAFEKDYFRTLEAQAADRHLERIKTGRLDAADLGAFYLEVLRDAGGVNAYLVNAAAYPILARHGELRPNRLRDAD
ncbi:Na/Pi cotransporter family protein [uncultured Castellaniella sp.]|uniref:Na/Pi cotransporter family protein n=1 Tax=uncultured Castellaniella sp. TaxID=647907 RepID=UPI002622EB6D|nr:Na/Pi cotransporter family protein [uncultured Castellaniella sp.]